MSPVSRLVPTLGFELGRGGNPPPLAPDVEPAPPLNVDGVFEFVVHAATLDAAVNRAGAILEEATGIKADPKALRVAYRAAPLVRPIGSDQVTLWRYEFEAVLL